MRKRIISAAGLICCLAAVYMSAQAGKKDFYENQTSLADEEYENTENEGYETAPISEINVGENAGHEYIEE